MFKWKKCQYLLNRKVYDFIVAEYDVKVSAKIVTNKVGAERKPTIIKVLMKGKLIAVVYTLRTY